MAIQGAGKPGNQVNQANQGATGRPSLGGVMRLGDAPPDFAVGAAEMLKGLFELFSPQKAVEKSKPTTSATKDEIAKARAEGKAEAEDEIKKKAAPAKTDALETPKVAETGNVTSEDLENLKPDASGSVQVPQNYGKPEDLSEC